MVDTSDYAGQGISPSTITGSFRITAPSGNVVYDNLINYQSGTLADIIGTTFLYTHRTIAGNLNAVLLEQGVYSIFYQVWDSNTSLTSTVTETFNLIYASPTVTIDGTVQVYTPSPLITLQDTTVYQVNSVDPTISRVATISYEPMLINNVLTTPTPTTGITATTTSNTFYSPTTELLSVVSNLTYVFSNYTVLDLVSGSESLYVDATTYCATVCGLNQLACDVQANPQDSSIANDFNLAMSYWTLIMANQNCGNMDVINGYLKDIHALGHFNSDCNCGCGDTFQQVVGLGGLVSAYNVISANSYITVSPVTSGGTTTFTIELSSAFVALVNSIEGATLIEGDNIVLSSVTSGANTTWTINALGTTVVSNNGSVLVTGTTTGNNTEYDLSLVPYNTTKITDTTLQVGLGRLGDNPLFETGLQPAVAGTYLCLFDADLYLDTNQQIVGVYYPYKTGTPAANINVGASVGHANWDSGTTDMTGIKKISSVTTIEILARDIININLNVFAMLPITAVKNANLTLIKIG